MPQAKFQIYKDMRGEFRWRFVSSNGRIVADSAESYTSEANALNGINIVKKDAPAAKVYRLNY